jgi:hypothetical protein
MVMESLRLRPRAHPVVGGVEVEQRVGPAQLERLQVVRARSLLRLHEVADVHRLAACAPACPSSGLGHLRSCRF